MTVFLIAKHFKDDSITEHFEHKVESKVVTVEPDVTLVV